MKRRLRRLMFFILTISMVMGMLGMSMTASAEPDEVEEQVEPTEPVAIAATAATTASAGNFTVTASVNMRAEGSTNARIIGVVHSGHTVEVLSHNPAGWSRVQVGNSTGFIRSDFLRVVGSGATFRTTAGVHLRASASVNSASLRTVPSGTNVEVTEHNPAGWSRVRVGTTNGFIRSDFLARGAGGAAADPGPGTPDTGANDTAIGTARTRAATNFRAGPSTNDRIIRTLASNTNVEILENLANGWSRVRQGGTVGFIRSDLLVATTTDQPDTPSGETVTRRTRAAVNLRAGPSTNDRILRTLATNTTVTILEDMANGWSRVNHNGTVGFIRSDLFVDFTPEPPEPPPPPEETVTRRTRAAVNLRAGSSTNDRIIRTLAANTTVTILEDMANGWSRVNHNGTVGFIRSDLFVDFTPEPPEPPPPPEEVVTRRVRAAVNLRAGPSTNDRILRTLATNTTVTILEDMANGWSRVNHNGTVGFIRSDLFVDFTPEPPEQPDQPEPPPPPPPEETVTRRTRGATNLRAGPSTNYRILRTLPGSAPVEVLEDLANGWSRVNHNGTIGFIRSDLLVEIVPDPDLPPIDPVERRTRAAVNLRAGPSTNYRIIRTLAANTAVMVLEELPIGWSRVDHNGTIGFIRSDLFAGGASSGTPVNTVGVVWNAMVAQNLPGVSDRPEHIAGIIGNLQSEAGLRLCPFQQEIANNQAGLGIMQWSHSRRTDLERFMWNNGISQTEFIRERNRHLHSTCTNTCIHPPEFLTRVLEVQVAFMFHELRHTWERQYLDFVNFPADRTGATGARAYAELFCVLVLRPSPGRANGLDDIQDVGVIEARRASPFGGVGVLDRVSFSGLAARRDRAEQVFRQFG